MKKYIKRFAFVAILAPIFLSCQDDFLDADVTRYTTQERHDELISNPETAGGVSKAAISKTYAIFQEYWDSHDDFGLRAFQFATDAMCEDVVLYGSQWFIYDYNLDNREANYRRTNSTWDQNYEIIAKINLHLETYFAEDSTDPVIMASKSEPLAIRAIAYFNLVNFYQHTYVGHENELGVPLSLKTTDENLPRATVKEVYAQIVEDLTYAAEHGKATSESTDVDKYVAAAYLAKVYAQMEDWANVKKYAAMAKQGGTDVVSAPGRGWSVGEKDMLWGYDVNTQTSTLWASFWSHLDKFLSRGYAAGGSDKGIHNLLYDKLPENDSRRKLYANYEQYPDIIDQMKASDPKNPKAEIYDYDQFKFVAGTPGMEQDYCFLRVQDPILLEIEATIELGDLGTAKTLLTDFAKKRNPDFVAPESQDELREEVRFQRRIELWAEGSTWFDMKRWKLPIDRTVEGTNHWTKIRVETDATRFFHKIPQSEIESNPNLVQNP
ncbi:SusD-like starch-binding protein associating with outer membrane [Balneicella halophila]|uniref:SusD-like starch-binding protein associating with outer membrane n=1 Tax=Balneicella halophila TaxID=1537566 RepID=A0A7L4UT95_BALHA|nr:RagB/SusD family nutrient uptake outer membrane protein [Balneicella halophila]PVX52557.1 SusD-like starch-binding protein associating with outer membrane [Balneicella halophila]